MTTVLLIGALSAVVVLEGLLVFSGSRVIGGMEAELDAARSQIAALRGELKTARETAARRLPTVEETSASMTGRQRGRKT